MKVVVQRQTGRVYSETVHKYTSPVPTPESMGAEDCVVLA